MSEKRKLLGKWGGKVDVFMEKKNIHIKIFKVKNQKNKIVITGHESKGIGKKVDGSLLGFKKLIRDENSLGWDVNPNPCGVSIYFQNRGSYQGGKMYPYKDQLTVFSSENTIDKLIKFLKKYITKGKVKKSTKRGGGKKTFKSEKKQEKKDYWKCMKKSKQNKINTIKCNKKRKKTLRILKKKYPKEWSQYQIDFMSNPNMKY
jgi:hypothetical protein